MTTKPGPAQGLPGLSIGDLARRTGLTTATLRAWETRHGFPRPTRLESGHRRYDERDVELVAQVVRRRDAGVRLEAAVAEAAALRRTPTASVFAELRRLQPHLAPQRLSKATLLALSWALEDEACARAQRPLLFAAFQHERFYRRAEARWSDLTRTAERAVVFADFTNAAAPRPGGAVRVHLPEEAPMRREWSLVCDAADHPAALAAWELPGQDRVPDRERMFEALWTLEPRPVREAARACAAMAEHLEPSLTGAFSALDGVAPEASDDLRAATGLFSRVLAYTDRAR